MSALDKFNHSLENRAGRTKETYLDELRDFLRWRELNSYDLLIQGAEKEMEDSIIEYIDHIKSVGLSFSKANKALSALQRFYFANRIELKWKYIKAFMPRREIVENQDRPYTKEEIMLLMDKADERAKLAILIMSTGGLRVGALPGIRIKDLIYLESEKLFAIRVYSNTVDEYFAFVTPQCSDLITKCMEGQKDGRWLFCNKREKDQPITEGAIQIDIFNLLVKSGLRTVGHRLERKPVQMAHGFRKFFRTQLTIAGIHQENAEYLVGHSNWLVRVYSKPSPAELYTRTEYAKAIPALTF